MTSSLFVFDSLIAKDAKVEAENIKKDKLLQAKEKFLELKSEHEKEILSKDKKIAEVEKRVRDKESQVSSELAKAKKSADDFEAKIADYNNRLEVLDKKQHEDLIQAAVEDIKKQRLRA